MTEVCDGCGFEAKNEQGLSVHQRACDYDDGVEESPDSDETQHTVFTADALSEREEQALERDDEQCVRCGQDEALVFHRYKDGVERLANVVTLCEECDDEVSGHYHGTKRSMVSR